MGQLDDLMAMDAAVFNDPDSMIGSESIVYTQTGTAGSPWTFNAQVFRELPEQVPGVVSQHLPNLTVFINKGAGPTVINFNTDTVTVSVDIGGTAVAQIVTGIIKQDAGGWLLALNHQG